jgi:hypothetical protein
MAPPVHEHISSRQSSSDSSADINGVRVGKWGIRFSWMVLPTFMAALIWGSWRTATAYGELTNSIHDLELRQGYNERWMKQVSDHFGLDWVPYRGNRE